MKFRPQVDEALFVIFGVSKISSSTLAWTCLFEEKSLSTWRNFIVNKFHFSINIIILFRPSDQSYWLDLSQCLNFWIVLLLPQLSHFQTPCSHSTRSWCSQSGHHARIEGRNVQPVWSTPVSGSLLATTKDVDQSENPWVRRRPGGGGIKVVRDSSLLSNRTKPSVAAARSSACHISPVQTIPVSSLPVNPFTTRPCRAQHAKRHCAKNGGRSS